MATAQSVGMGLKSIASWLSGRSAFLSLAANQGCKAILKTEHRPSLLLPVLVQVVVSADARLDVVLNRVDHLVRNAELGEHRNSGSLQPLRSERLRLAGNT